MIEAQIKDDVTAMFWKGQRYDFNRRQPHARADGSQTELLVWNTHCATCGEAIEIMTPVGGSNSPSRRCTRHKRPGASVKN